MRPAVSGQWFGNLNQRPIASIPRAAAARLFEGKRSFPDLKAAATNSQKRNDFRYHLANPSTATKNPSPPRELFFSPIPPYKHSPHPPRRLEF